MLDAIIVASAGILVQLVLYAFTYGKLTQTVSMHTRWIDHMTLRVDQQDQQLGRHGERLSRVEGWLRMRRDDLTSEDNKDTPR